MGYQKLSIKDAVNYISDGRMFLPEIQRKFVWKEEQIENLFDSLLLGYPIGALLFWKTSKKVINDSDDALNLYEFIRDYHERDCHDNKKAPEVITSDFENYYIVLDGQQRLSSLYIAIKGSLARKLPRCWWNNDESFPKKELYMNLQCKLTNKIIDDDESKRFKFLTESEAKEEPKKWFKVKDIFRFEDEYKISSYVIKNCDEDEVAGKNLITLYKIFNSKENSPLSFYEIDEADYDDVLNIFVRVNSSGTPLSKTDLLFSTIVSSWKGGRDEIETLINSMNSKGEKFGFNTDFIMRACLTLTDSPINLKINSFKKANVDKVSNNWDKIKQALLDTVSFLTKAGFSDQSITSYNALMPVVYYLYRGGELNSANIINFKRYFIVAQIKNLFGVASNTAITETRKAVQAITNFKKTPFTLDLFKDVKLTGDLNFKVTKETIDRCFEYEKGSYTFMVLSLLYPEVKLEAMSFHQDHVHPYTGFDNKKIKTLILDKDTVTKWQSMRNKLPNLELLQGPENESKNAMPLKDWLAKGNSVKFMKEGISTEFKDFEKFYEERESIMKKELSSILGVIDDSPVAE
jgi:uncharacterized protein with ParB-like and HNH nuclease domain